MKTLAEKRFERRLNYDWPIRFAESFGRTLFRGRIVDVSSEGVCFRCSEGGSYQVGDKLTSLFSVPRFERSDGFDIANYNRTGVVCRIEENMDYRLIAMRFTEPLFFKPGDQGVSESESRTRLARVSV